MKITLLRKKFVTNPRFQFSFVAYTLGVSLLTNLIFYSANAYFFAKFYEKGRELNLPANHPFFDFLLQQRGVMNLIFVIAAGLAFFLLMVFGIYISHRVAGPLWRMQSYFESNVDSNDPPQLKFRKNDYFHEVADSVNKFMDARRKR